MSDDERFEQLLQFFKVLGNKNRLQILGLLANQERNVGELALMLDLKEPTVSHHLGLLKELGLVDTRPDGNLRLYRLNQKALERMNKDIFSPRNLATLVDVQKSEETWEEKVLKAFVANGRLLDIPARRKKRLVVLTWLVQQLDPTRQYHELELNDWLKQFHDDCASLRRYMVEEQLLIRERNTYWRPTVER
ncbi:MAG: metalloregulator ArsR/SmtB family transcription factor [Anaerolineales bacterium]|nr:metalloregulator ArsR/SmtB family transcription factor [Anaerolineales bacterium]